MRTGLSGVAIRVLHWLGHDRRLPSLCRFQRQRDNEPRARPRSAFHLYGTAMRLNYLTDDVETEPKTSVVAGGDSALEALKDALELFGFDTDALVLNGNRRVVAVLIQGNSDRLSAPVFERI